MTTLYSQQQYYSALIAPAIIVYTKPKRSRDFPLHQQPWFLVAITSANNHCDTRFSPSNTCCLFWDSSSVCTSKHTHSSRKRVSLGNSSYLPQQSCTRNPWRMLQPLLATPFRHPPVLGNLGQPTRTPTRANHQILRKRDRRPSSRLRLPSTNIGVCQSLPKTGYCKL